MKKIFVAGLFIVALFASPVLAADSTHQKVSKDVHQLKKDYSAQVHKELTKIEGKIRQFKRDVKKGGKAAETDLTNQVKKLEAQKAGADKKLVELEKSTGDAWKDLRQGVDDSVTDLKRSVDDAISQFKEKGNHPK